MTEPVENISPPPVTPAITKPTTPTSTTPFPVFVRIYQPELNGQESEYTFIFKPGVELGSFSIKRLAQWYASTYITSALHLQKRMLYTYTIQMQRAATH